MFKLILIILFIHISIFKFVNAEVNIVFVDMDKIISTSKPGSSILNQLTKINNKNLEYLKNEENKIKEKEATLIAQKNIISEVEFQKRVEKLKLEINDYKKKMNEIISDFNKLKIENTNNLLKMINPILVKFSNEKSISIILQKKDLVIGKSELDITEDIIKIINSEINEFMIK